MENKKTITFLGNLTEHNINLSKHLNEENFNLVYSNNIDVFKMLLAGVHPDILIVDLDSLTGNRIFVIEQLYALYKNPIFTLTNHPCDNERVRLYNSCIYEYIIYPIEYHDLIRKIKILQRFHHSYSSAKVYQLGHIKVDQDKNIFYVDEEMIKLTKKETAILNTLVKNAGSVVSLEYLLDKFWSGNKRSLTSLRVFMKNIRKKLEINPENPRILETVSGVGYRINQQRKRTTSEFSF